MKYEDVVDAWNKQADSANDWSALGDDEKIEFAMRIEREACAVVCEKMTHALAEYLYGHSREKAVEWAKEEKYDSDAYRADAMLSIVAEGIRMRSNV